MNFKNCTDEQDCPVPEDVRDTLLVFHMDLLVHCGQSQSSSHLQQIYI